MSVLKAKHFIEMLSSFGLHVWKSIKQSMFSNCSHKINNRICTDTVTKQDMFTLHLSPGFFFMVKQLLRLYYPDEHITMSIHWLNRSHAVVCELELFFTQPYSFQKSDGDRQFINPAMKTLSKILTQKQELSTVMCVHTCIILQIILVLFSLKKRYYKKWPDCPVWDRFYPLWNFIKLYYICYITLINAYTHKLCYVQKFLISTIINKFKENGQVIWRTYTEVQCLD